MNSKAIRRQLLAAVAMVLVAAVALGSSTYAWFASNNKVTASTAQISASAQNALSIKDSDEPEWKTSITLNNGGSATGTVEPIHYYRPADATSIAWYSIGTDNTVLYSDKKDASVPFDTYIGDTTTHAGMFNKETELANKNVSKTVQDVTTNYVIGNQFQIKATGSLDSNGEKVDATVKVQLPDNLAATTDAAKIYQAFHVVFVVTPNGGSASYYDVDLGGGTLALDDNNKVVLNGVATTVIDSISADKEYDVVAYLFLEGEDSDCFTKNATSVQNMRVTYEFEKSAKTA